MIVDSGDYHFSLVYLGRIWPKENSPWEADEGKCIFEVFEGSNSRFLIDDLYFFPPNRSRNWFIITPWKKKWTFQVKKRAFYPKNEIFMLMGSKAHFFKASRLIWFWKKKWTFHVKKWAFDPKNMILMFLGSNAHFFKRDIHFFVTE